MLGKVKPLSDYGELWSEKEENLLVDDFLCQQKSYFLADSNGSENVQVKFQKYPITYF